mmetsp:Transcript_12303/g.38876  ORF Transcript_12303/g.38876 Transcript_12303/m.38876 type:complete len:470 (+) Transcript_12303:22-1431(+)
MGPRMGTTAKARHATSPGVLGSLASPWQAQTAASGPNRGVAVPGCEAAWQARASQITTAGPLCQGNCGLLDGPAKGLPRPGRATMQARERSCRSQRLRGQHSAQGNNASLQARRSLSSGPRQRLGALLSAVAGRDALPGRRVESAGKKKCCLGSPSQCNPWPMVAPRGGCAVPLQSREPQWATRHRGARGMWPTLASAPLQRKLTAGAGGARRGHSPLSAGVAPHAEHASASRPGASIGARSEPPTLAAALPGLARPCALGAATAVGALAASCAAGAGRGTDSGREAGDGWPTTVASNAPDGDPACVPVSVGTAGASVRNLGALLPRRRPLATRSAYSAHRMQRPGPWVSGPSLLDPWHCRVTPDCTSMVSVRGGWRDSCRWKPSVKIPEALRREARPLFPAAKPARGPRRWPMPSCLLPLRLLCGGCKDVPARLSSSARVKANAEDGNTSGNCSTSGGQIQMMLPSES